MPDEFKQIIIDGERISLRVPEPDAVARIALAVALIEWLEKAAPAKDGRPAIDDEVRQAMISRAVMHHWPLAKFHAAIAANGQLLDDRQLKKITADIVADAKARGQA